MRKMLEDTISRLPAWIRRDLATDDVGLRRRAEETLVAMIANIASVAVDDDGIKSMDGE